MRKLIILQTVVPDYRYKIFSFIKEKIGSGFEIYAGSYYFEKSVKTDSEVEFINPIKNNYFFNRKFLFQFGALNILTRKSIIILELNPRIISNWLILIIRNIINRKTVLWGHAWPRNGKNSSSDKLRNLMRKLASAILVYTHTQKEELQKKMPNKKIFCSPNSLYYKSEMKTHTDGDKINNVIYVGRLTKEKKPLLLIKAFERIIKEVPVNSKLLIVGDGEERNKLTSYVKQKDLEERILLLGHISEYKDLKKLYDSSLVSVSPGYVGLSVTQSFSFGVPMIVSRDENHSPEIEAVNEEVNSIFFETDNIENLAKRLKDFYNNKKEWILKRNTIVENCKNKYSVEIMARSFLDLSDL